METGKTCPTIVNVYSVLSKPGVMHCNKNQKRSGNRIAKIVSEIFVAKNEN